MTQNVIEPWKQRTQDEYREIKLIGQGAYGAVYQVEHRATGQTFALKKVVIRVSDEGVPQSMLREISTLVKFKRFKHRNLTELIDVFATQNKDHELHIGMILEKCDWDLYDFMRTIPRDMPETQIRTLARQIINGISFLHSHNIIHRDLKPQNILINRNLSVKLADFGLARLASACAQFTTVVVTLWYRSPEVLLQTTYGSSVDVWAFGCILSEMYNRQTLFPGRTEADQLKIIVNKMGKPSESDWPSDAIIPLSFYEWTPRQSLYQLNPKLSQAACRFIEKCIRWNGDMRCTALEALNDSFFDGPYSQGYENLFDEPLPNAHQQ
ncbi:unnamed protein product, partial [Mesorhabditis belari]|uniref:cyclin-dependent kinase n=1 Tax=Mesorhabditis belari TaxID=2138241 RepID=A0AAF3F6L6_9BILA